jgi:hypothetical protein
LEHSRTFVILAQGSGPLFRPGVQPHQLTVRWLVQRVQSRPTPRVGDGHLQRTLGSVASGQPRQRAQQLIAQPFCLEELPLVESGAVSQGESSQEIVAVQLRRLG